MNVVILVCLGFVLAGLFPGEIQAQEKVRDKKTIEAELDHFRDELFHTFNKGEYQAMLEKYCHKDVIATWQDGTTSKGHAEVLAEFAKLKEFIDKWTVTPTTDKRLILNDGKLVIASGNMKDQYELKRGANVGLNSRWQATLIWENERWLLIGFSATTNAFDNQVVDLYLRQERYISAAVAGGVGLVVGIIVMLLVMRRRRAV